MKLMSNRVSETGNAFPKPVGFISHVGAGAVFEESIQISEWERIVKQISAVGIRHREETRSV